jgi:calcium/calmodulin-dependent protein kinase (CaM kinase) II
MSEMQDSDIIALNQKLLDAIVCGDYNTYSSLCSEDITCFEPECEGHQVQGLAFHKFYFDLPAPPSLVPKNISDLPPTVVTMSSVHVRRLGDNAAVISYVRVNQSCLQTGEPKVTKACETRVWQKVDSGKWKNVHMHRSAM